MSESISRRGFLARGAPLLGLLAPGAFLEAWAGQPTKQRAQRPYYILNPEWSNGRRCNVREGAKDRDCHGCKACHNHAKNKIFATRRAADRGRAHPGCKCKVVRGGMLDEATWSALFGGSKIPQRRVVDRRKTRTRRVLRNGRRGL